MDAVAVNDLAKDARKAGARVGLKADRIVIQGGKPLRTRAIRTGGDLLVFVEDTGRLQARAQAIPRDSRIFNCRWPTSCLEPSVVILVV